MNRAYQFTPKTLRRISETINVFAWPGLLIILWIIFRVQVFDILNLLPSKIEKADTLTVVGLTIELDDSIEDLGDLQSKIARECLKVISPNALEILLFENHSLIEIEENIDNEQEKHRELINLGLVAELSKETLLSEQQKTENRRPRDQKFVYGTRITPLGLEIKKFSIQLVRAIINYDFFD